ncbi:hypothetical protein FAUST_11285 [Fusarium austroamericanum]|uniref:Antifungal protein n=1 Tax=Fusarium austroamericanum TaxID=282268 RepID=A0AAN5YZJ5_FUSAU|nr:hypothetical protein FAUST_11285 [Fusarium austroamericanum]
MKFSSVTLLLFVATGAVATPVDSLPNQLDARDGLFPRRTFPGKCTRSDNRCKYENSNGKTVTISCGTAANKKCTKDNADCVYDDANRSVKCD